MQPIICHMSPGSEALLEIGCVHRAWHRPAAAHANGVKFSRHVEAAQVVDLMEIFPPSVKAKKKTPKCRSDVPQLD